MAAKDIELKIVNIVGVQFVIKELKDTEPKLLAQFRKELVAEAAPLLPKIRSAIPMSAPLRGMEHRGSTGYDPARIKVTAKANFRKRAGKQSLISFRATSNALRIADMAGRKASGKTSSGRALIAGLNSGGKGKPSRIVYPSVEKEMPALQKSMIDIISDYAAKVNRTILVESQRGVQ